MRAFTWRSALPRSAQFFSETKMNDVFDENDGERMISVHAPDQFNDQGDLIDIETANGLVEENELGPGGERAGDHQEFSL